jgi:cytochrome P450
LRCVARVRAVGVCDRRRDAKDRRLDVAATDTVNFAPDWDLIHDMERAERPDVPWLDIDLTAAEVYRDGVPYELFRTRRDQHPVWRHPTVPTNRSPDGVGFWAVLGHPEVQAVSRDWRTYSSLEGLALTPTAPENRGHTILTSDPPTHTRIRKLISAGFTPRMIARLDDLVMQRATEVLDAAAAKNEINFVRDVAYALPMHIISDIIGIPEADRADVFHWTDVIMRAADPTQQITPAALAATQRSLFGYAAQLGEEKRHHPVDDVWSILSTVTIEDDEGRSSSLSPLELDQFFLILTIAGSETTRNVISSGLLALVAHREQMEMLRHDVGLETSATEELLRWASPVTCHLRTATRDHELAGQPIEAGDRLAMFFPAANRDPRTFDDPERFDIRREPDFHVAFGGGGAHFCLGANLARREIGVMFRQLLHRFPDLELTGPVTHIVTGIEQTVAVSLDDFPVRLRPS